MTDFLTRDSDSNFAIEAKIEIDTQGKADRVYLIIKLLYIHGRHTC